MGIAWLTYRWARGRMWQMVLDSHEGNLRSTDRPFMRDFIPDFVLDGIDPCALATMGILRRDQDHFALKEEELARAACEWNYSALPFPQLERSCARIEIVPPGIQDRIVWRNLWNDYTAKTGAPNQVSRAFNDDEAWRMACDGAPDHKVLLVKRGNPGGHVFGFVILHEHRCERGRPPAARIEHVHLLYNNDSSRSTAHRNALVVFLMLGVLDVRWSRIDGMDRLLAGPERACRHSPCCLHCGGSLRVAHLPTWEIKVPKHPELLAAIRVPTRRSGGKP